MEKWLCAFAVLQKALDSSSIYIAKCDNGNTKKMMTTTATETTTTAATTMMAMNGHISQSAHK